MSPKSIVSSGAGAPTSQAEQHLTSELHIGFRLIETLRKRVQGLPEYRFPNMPAGADDSVVHDMPAAVEVVAETLDSIPRVAVAALLAEVLIDWNVNLEALEAEYWRVERSREASEPVMTAKAAAREHASRRRRLGWRKPDWPERAERALEKAQALAGAARQVAGLMQEGHGADIYPMMEAIKACCDKIDDAAYPVIHDYEEAAS